VEPLVVGFRRLRARRRAQLARAVLALDVVDDGAGLEEGDVAVSQGGRRAADCRRVRARSSGMGETDEEIVDLAFALRRLDPESVPVNFLIPFAGTPLEGRWELTPERCLRILALFRFCFPDVEVRLAGGREIHLRGMQVLALHVANSIFLGDYLTSEGQPGADDLQLIADAGFTVEGLEESMLPAARHDLVTLRHRGAGSPAAAE